MPWTFCRSPRFFAVRPTLLVAAGRTGKTVNIKKGQFVAPARHAPRRRRRLPPPATPIVLTERGSSFGYNNLVVDMRGLVIMRELGYPVVFDATHSVQLPGAAGAARADSREFIEPLATRGRRDRSSRWNLRRSPRRAGTSAIRRSQRASARIVGAAARPRSPPSRSGALIYGPRRVCLWSALVCGVSVVHHMP